MSLLLAIDATEPAISYNKHDYKLYYYKGKALAKLGYYLPAVVQLNQALMCCNDQNLNFNIIEM